MPISAFDIFSNYTCDRPSVKKITYTYDSMNRRVARTDENGTTQYLYGNPNHPFQLTAVRSPSGSLSRYHYDDFGLLFALERDNNWYYITTDQLGTPRVVCAANGELVKVLEYDSFGQIIADSNPEFELYVSFAGGLIDGETELVRFGFRDYDAVAGKWTAKDPIGFASREVNLYGYVVNDPVNLHDPLGLDPIRGIPGYNGVVGYFFPGNQPKLPQNKQLNNDLDNQRRTEEKIKKRGYRVNPTDPPTNGRPSDHPTDPRGGQGKRGQAFGGGRGKCPGPKAPPGAQWSLLLDFWPWITPEMLEKVMGTIES